MSKVTTEHYIEQVIKFRVFDKIIRTFDNNYELLKKSSKDILKSWPEYAELSEELGIYIQALEIIERMSKDGSTEN